MKKQTAVCCRRFTLLYSPEELKKKSYLADFDKIINMLIYIGYLAENVLGEPTEYHQHHYTCKHLDKEKGACIIYEQRPAMCSGFPYNTECDLKKQCGTYKHCNGTKRERSMSYKISKYIDKIKYSRIGNEIRYRLSKDKYGKKVDCENI